MKKFLQDVFGTVLTLCVLMSAMMAIIAPWPEEQAVIGYLSKTVGLAIMLAYGTILTYLSILTMIDNWKALKKLLAGENKDE